MSRIRGRGNKDTELALNVDVSSFGVTREEALANLKEAVELCFEGESGDACTPVSEIAVGQEMVDAWLEV